MNYLSKIIISLALSVASLFGYHQQANLGVYNPTGGGTYRLQSSIGTSDTSLTLTSFKEPISKIAYTMSYLNSSIEYATIDPQSSTKEFVSFTGITQNSDGTALLTGLTRGLGFSYPYTASTTLQQAHSGQSIFILSNPPQLTNQYGNKNNDETITGLWTFNQNPVSTAGNATTSTQLITLSQAQGLANQGAATATQNVAGISQLATQAQIAAGTDLGVNSPLVLQAKHASSTPVLATTTIVVTGTNGKIDANFLATSSVYNWTGNNAHSGTNLFTASTTMTATTSIAANSTTNGALVLNGVKYKLPSTEGASSTALMTDGSGSLSWNSASSALFVDTTQRVTSINATTTIYTYTISPGTFGTGNILKISANKAGSLIQSSNAGVEIQFGNGSSSTTLASLKPTSSGNDPMRLEVWITASSTLTTQLTTGLVTEFETNNVGLATYTNAITSYNAGSNLYIAFRGLVGDTRDTIGFQGITIEKY